MPVIYAVTATVPEALVEAYVAWLLGGHVQAVVAGGAEQAWVTRLGPDQVESRYLFASPEALAAYERDVAPGLRADGVARFVEPHGVTFRRASGPLLGHLP
ncbi:MAG: DUF4286 family protein [Myxococcales bacterium]|nr:DUF4286 family protein [Myxococcales bacterium]MCB9548525.1 DUF4286 family protein [Myxococcales bacterium]